MVGALLITGLALAAPADDAIAQRLLGQATPAAEAEVPLGPEAPPAPSPAFATPDPTQTAPAQTAGSVDSRIAQQLLGDAEPAASSEPFGVDAAGGAGAAGMSVLAMAALVGCGWYIRRRLFSGLGKAATSDRPVRVIGRQTVSGTSALILIEVDNGEGGTRRLLVGTGGGAPNLVADLGGDIPGFVDLPAPELAAPQRAAPRPSFNEHFQAVAPPAPARAGDSDADGLPTEPPRVVMPAARAYAKAAPRPATRPATRSAPKAAPKTASPPDRRVSEAEMKRARSLVDEVLTERLQKRGDAAAGRSYRGVA